MPQEQLNLFKKTVLICPIELWSPGIAHDLPTHWPGTRV